MTDSVIQIAIDGWRLGLRSMMAMPKLTGSAFVALLAGRELIGSFEQPQGDPVSLAGFVAYAVANRGLVAVVGASVLIAVHRIILLSEIADRPVWRVPQTYARFVNWLLLLNFVWLLPYLMFIALGTTFPALNGLGFLLCWALVVTFSVRCMLLLPAMAVNTPSAHWHNAWADSRGHAWKIFGAWIVAGLPMVAVGMVLFSIHGLRPAQGAWLVVTVLETLVMCFVGGGVASRLFWNFAVSLRQHPPTRELPGPA